MDAGSEIEVLGCTKDGGGGGMRVDTGGTEIEVFDCIIGGEVTEPSTTAKV